MYGAMREHARPSSQLAGLAIAVAMTAALGYALANGFMGQVAKFIEQPMTFTPVVDDPAPVEDRKPTFEMDATTLAPPIPVPPIPRDIFIPDDNGEVIRPPVEPRGRVDGGTVGGGTGRTASPVRTRPALLTREAPPFPAGEIRRRSTGTTGLKVCLDAAGRVTSVNLASSSGRAALDAAALKWIRNARFTPATSDGVAEAMCGHDVLYEWKVEDAH